MIRVLFVCEHNSARSQMAGAYLRHLGGNDFQVESAGLEAGNINPNVIEVLAEEGIDISGHTTNSVMDFFRQGRQYDMVITVCSPEVDEKCPLFPGRTLRFNWPFPDPSALKGDKEEVLAKVREIRDQIKIQVGLFLEEYREKGLKLFLQQDQDLKQ